jgi:hypothetical protein
MNNFFPPLAAKELRYKLRQIQLPIVESLNVVDRSILTTLNQLDKQLESEDGLVSENIQEIWSRIEIIVKRIELLTERLKRNIYS